MAICVPRSSILVWCVLVSSPSAFPVSCFTNPKPEMNRKTEMFFQVLLRCGLN